MTARITGANHGIRTDEKDETILRERVAGWKRVEGPRVGDYIVFSDGVTHRFSHDWGDGLQTSESGSFYFGNGYMSFSGGLNPCVPREAIRDSGRTRPGHAWFFHHGFAHAHSGVYVEIDCRVYETALASDHWHAKPAKKAEAK